MSVNPLFTIGHSNREFEELVELLSENCVAAVADVRSSPYSRQFPQFNTDALGRSLRDHRIQYFFLGHELGARRSEPECYVGDVAKYDLIAKTDTFAKGLDRLRLGMESHRIALLCAEKDPLVCHRMILVCRALRNECAISHIIDRGHVQDHSTTEARLLKATGLPDRGLFQSRDELIDEAYSKQGERIAYRRESLAVANSPEDE